QQQKRARAQLSCTACRVGKLKCNRAHPACDQCIKRNKESSCQYIAAPPRKKPNQSMKERIKHLENLVVELYNSNNSESPESDPSANGSKSTPSQNESPANGLNSAQRPSAQQSWTVESDENNNAFGRMKISKTESKYVGGSHWEAILDNIAEVRAALDEPEDGPEGVSASPASSDQTAATFPVQSLLNPNPNIKPTRADLIRALPSRPRADSLVAGFFNSQSPTVVAIHGPTFQKEYQEFWGNPDSRSLQWLAVLFGIISLTSRQEDYGVSHFRAPKGQTSEETRKYHSMAASAIILSNYMRPAEGICEAIMLYTEGVYMDTEHEDDHLEVWLLLGLNIRVSLRMGYHRDGGNHTKISAFLSEMRRRQWSLLYQFDVLLSFEMGLPGMMLQTAQDVKPPSNLFDRDFTSESDPLPPGRPDDELTPCSYSRTKSRIAKAFGKIAEHSHAINPPSRSEVLMLDKELQEASDAIPPALRVRSLEDSITDPAGLVMCRFNLDLLVQKSRCLLHRRVLTEAGSGEFVDYSRSNCIDAAIKLLEQLARVDAACEKKMMPRGWYISSLNVHDFLLASMVLSLELDRRLKALPENGDAVSGSQDLEEMRSMLETTYQIWQKPMHRSAETQKASKVVLLMLSKV
ncbi:hypothetical protein NA57DRAFT_9239, partial [Rhizodiscina lignyota]